jgi:hypothetical protein
MLTEFFRRILKYHNAEVCSLKNLKCTVFLRRILTISLGVLISNEGLSLKDGIPARNNGIFLFKFAKYSATEFFIKN